MEAYELARGYSIERLEKLLLKQLLHRMDIESAGYILAHALQLQAFDLVGVAVDFLARAWCMGVTGIFSSQRCMLASLEEDRKCLNQPTAAFEQQRPGKT